MAKALIRFFLVIYHSPFQRPRWTGVYFPATSFYPWTTCVFPSLVSESFLKNYWRAQFYLKMAKALTRFFQRPQWTEGDFPATSFYPWTTCVFPALVFESFLKSTLTFTILSQSVEGPDPVLFGDLPSPFQCPQWTGVDFPAPSFYPWTTCVFPSLVSESFLKKYWRAQFYLNVVEGPDPVLFGDLLLSISMPTMDRGRFSSPFLLSVDNMCLSFFSQREFSEKMLTCIILSQNGEGPSPIFVGDISSPFQHPRWTVVDFPVTTFDPWTTCVFPSLVFESFLKKCWRAQFYLKVAKALTRVFWWFLLSITTRTMDRGRFSCHFLLSVDNMCLSFFSLARVFWKNADVHNFISKCWKP